MAAASEHCMIQCGLIHLENQKNNFKIIYIWISNEQIKVEYSSSEYRLDEFDGKKMIFVQKTNSYYSEEEFQVLYCERALPR